MGREALQLSYGTNVSVVREFPRLATAEPDRLTVRSFVNTGTTWRTTWQRSRFTRGSAIGIRSHLGCFASNDIIAGRLRTAGFTDITITGAGSTRSAEALWSAADATAEMPKQIAEVVEL